MLKTVFVPRGIKTPGNKECLLTKIQGNKNYWLDIKCANGIYVLSTPGIKWYVKQMYMKIFQNPGTIHEKIYENGEKVSMYGRGCTNV